jgi:hypothetical protein
VPKPIAFLVGHGLEWTALAVHDEINFVNSNATQQLFTAFYNVAGADIDAFRIQSAAIVQSFDAFDVMLRDGVNALVQPRARIDRESLPRELANVTSCGTIRLERDQEALNPHAAKRHSLVYAVGTVTKNFCNGFAI